MAVDPLVLVANPGSASRKYALFASTKQLAGLHFEYVHEQIVCTFTTPKEHKTIPVAVATLADASHHVLTILREYNILQSDQKPRYIGVRVVAPGRYFLQDRHVTDEVIAKLTALLPRAPLHIDASLKEMRSLHVAFSKIPIIAVSDSAFHLTKPERAWHYGLPLRDADQLEIRRYGYHGLSIASVVRTLKKAGKHASKIIVCHLGSGASVTAVLNGKSVDTTMGYSPLEGLVMGTRSGSLDVTAAHVIKTTLKLSDAELDEYLNKRCGLLGLGGSNDIRELLHRTAQGEHRAGLALDVYVYNVQKAIGQMTAVLNGIETLVFTGAVGERSAPMRQRIMANLDYLDLPLNERANNGCNEPLKPTSIGKTSGSKPIYVVSTDEAGEIARRVYHSVSRAV